MNEVWIGRTRRTTGSIVAAVDDRIFPSGDIMTHMNDSDGTSFWNGTSALRVLSVLLLVFLPLSGALAQPTVTGTSGEWEHGRSVTIVGGGFGIKNPAAPLWWDNGEGQVLNNHSVVRSRYNDAWPRSVTQDGGASNIQYRATGHRGVSTPHKFSDTFIAGCHDDQGECLGGEVGQNVGLTVSDGNRHEKWYVSYYLTVGPCLADRRGQLQVFQLGDDLSVPHVLESFLLRQRQWMYERISRRPACS